MLKRLALLASLICTLQLTARAQDISPAFRAGQAQVGVAYTNANTDEFPDRIGGISIYGTFDFTQHFGVEGAVHLLTVQTPDQYSQSSYEGGIRYVRHYGRYSPYARVAGGVGSYSEFGQVHFSDSFNMLAIAGGLDYKLARKFNARAEFEYQNWYEYPPNKLDPYLVTIGVAYRIR